MEESAGAIASVQSNAPLARSMPCSAGWAELKATS